MMVAMMSFLMVGFARVTSVRNMYCVMAEFGVIAGIVLMGRIGAVINRTDQAVIMRSVCAAYIGAQNHLMVGYIVAAGGGGIGRIHGAACQDSDAQDCG